MNVPEGYRGVVVRKTDRILPRTSAVEAISAFGAAEDEEDQDDEEDEPQQEVKVMDEVGQFDQIMVWGHESLPVDGEDPYMKGMQEWIKFSRAVSKRW